MAEPWFRKQTRTWYISWDGKQVRLGKDKEAAFKRWHAMEATKIDYDDPAFDQIAELFLSWSEKHNSADMFEWYGRFLVPACKAFGKTPIRLLKKHHLTTWLDEEVPTQGKQRCAITACKRCLNWAQDEGLIPHNPIARMRRPPAGSRDTIIDATDLGRILKAADRGRGRQYRRGAFRAFVLAMVHSGCRPGEVRRVTAWHYDKRVPAWVFPKKENKTGGKTKRPRVVRLTACLDTLTRIFAHYRPDGNLFLNGNGDPWTANAIRCRMRRMRDKLGLPGDVVSYTFRHTFTTDGMVNGVDDQTLAELLGHTSTSMIRKHYGHLDQRKGHMQKALERARPKIAPVPTPTSVAAGEGPQ
jgi:integrase